MQVDEHQPIHLRQHKNEEANDQAYDENEHINREENIHNHDHEDNQSKGVGLESSPGDRHKASTASSATRGQKPDPKRMYTTYSCQSCSRMDLQLSICLKAINFLLNRHEHGYTDTLEEFDPIIKKLYLDRGYKEHRRFPDTSLPRHRVNVSPDTNEDDDRKAKFSIKMPQLSKPELFGDPEARWSEIQCITQLTRSSIQLNSLDSKKCLTLDVKDGRIIDRLEHGLSGKL